MKVLHLCLANFYIDNYSYQENMLPKYHKKLGMEVEIVASLVSFDENGKICLLEKGGSYINEHGIRVHRLEYKNIPGSKRLRMYEGTLKAITEVNPDIIFIHGCQFLDIKTVINYVKINSHVKVYVDNHADFSNSARTWVSKNILHKIIWRKCAKMILPYTTKFYGVLPARVKFLEEIYKLPKEKIELLVMGADDEKVKEVQQRNIKEELRGKYGIKSTDFLIITGGKIDLAKKQTLLLMNAIKEMGLNNVKLIIFGSVVNEMKDAVNKLLDGRNIQFIGWIPAEESYKYFEMADLVIFPGRHSVFWEQVTGQGIPMVVKYWEGTTHIDVGGNCKFLFEDSVSEIKERINEIVNDKTLYENMKSTANIYGRDAFSYEKIAKRSIQ